MKRKEEVIKRIICLLCFTDRCALENKIFDGIRRSLAERENQREMILGWLKWKNYYDCLSQTEKQIFEIPVVRKTNNRVLHFYNNYECIEPLLWSLGLVDRLSDYNDFVLDDLHPPLKIGPEHSLDMVSESCNLLPDEIINNYREIAMLWYWRCLESEKNNLKTMNYLNAIKNIFGDDYVKLLEKYEFFDVTQGDFVVRGKTIDELSTSEIAKLWVIAERRFYAFEWLCTDDDWDNVDLVC